MRLGQRAVAFYRTTAIMFLNALLLLAALELIASGMLAAVRLPAVKSWLAGLTGRPNDLVSYYQRLPYYTQQNWSLRYWDEFRLALTQRYQPYVTWRSEPFSGETIVIGEDGTRRTPGAECGPDAYTVFAFGGSALWGWGAPDWATIPAFLQEGLRARHGGPVCVVNFGENAYVSMQSLIHLELVLASGRVPDAVVFYDGVNDVLAASQTGQPIVHQNYAEISALFEHPRHPLMEWIQGFGSYELLQKAISQVGAAGDSDSGRVVDVQALADGIAHAYLSTYKAVGALAGVYGFDYYFFWQPYIVVGSKRLSREERSLITDLNWELRLDSALTALFKATYARIAGEASRTENLYYAGDAFDAVESPIWIDTWGHITPEGNRVVAGLILAAMDRRSR